MKYTLLIITTVMLCACNHNMKSHYKYPTQSVTPQQKDSQYKYGH
ncbi:hypothetical protein Psal081_03426 (plasmid) [Piscirickettsia salmonis]|nr:hypothetical protein Psal081_03426 [Piscirickettsia salmonis]